MKIFISALISLSTCALSFSLPTYAETKKTEIPSSTPKIEIFVTSWCPYCKNLESFLKSRQLRFTRYDIERDSAAAARFKELGGEGIPLILIDSKIVLKGFDETSFLETLHKVKSRGNSVT